MNSNDPNQSPARSRPKRLAESARRQLRSYVAALGLDLGILLHVGPVPRFHRELAGRRATRGRRDSGSFESIRAIRVIRVPQYVTAAHQNSSLLAPRSPTVPLNPRRA